MAEPVALKSLLRQRHWQTYSTFCVQYDKAARTIDTSLVGSYPSRAQLHRWQAGEVKGLPYPRHCQVLEAMFPGITVAQMFAPADDDAELAIMSTPEQPTVSTLLDSIKDNLEALDSLNSSWRKDSIVRGSNSPGLPMSSAVAIRKHRNERGPEADIAEHIAQSVVLLGKSMGLSDPEVSKLGKLGGNLVDLKMECSIDIDTDGWALVTYCHEIVNLTSRPVKRMTREQWFEMTSGPLKIEPHPNSDRKVHIQRIHDTTGMSKFACLFSPAIEPGEVGTISYTSQGGRFVHNDFWCQSVPRYTRYFTLKIRHRGVAMVLNCTAIEEHIDGSETSAIEDLVCSDEDGGALITLTRDYLQPGQAVTVRWRVSQAASRPS